MPFQYEDKTCIVVVRVSADAILLDETTRFYGPFDDKEIATAFCKANDQHDGKRWDVCPLEYSMRD